MFTPHYDQVPYVIGIAIAGDSLRMTKISRRGLQHTTDLFYLNTKEGCIGWAGCGQGVLHAASA